MGANSIPRDADRINGSHANHHKIYFTLTKMVGNLSNKKMDYLFRHVIDRNNRQYQSPMMQTELTENEWELFQSPVRQTELTENEWDCFNLP